MACLDKNEALRLKNILCVDKSGTKIYEEIMKAIKNREDLAEFLTDSVLFNNTQYQIYMDLRKLYSGEFYASV